MQSILITIDVEDWFQVENFKPYIPFSTWNSCELRVEKNVHKLLDLFDSITVSNSINTTNTINAINFRDSGISKLKIQKVKLPRRVRATFFILGWIAERLPNLVKEVWDRGHEVASHGYNHELCGSINHKDLKQDLIKSKKLLEDITGSEIYGYRAPSFSINDDILQIIEDCGYRYDSSYNSFGLHGRYGKINLNGQPKKGIAYKISDSFYEIPISNLKIDLPFWSKTRKKKKSINVVPEDNPINPTNTTNPRCGWKAKRLGGYKAAKGGQHIAVSQPPSFPASENGIPASQHPSIPASIELPWGGGGYFRLIPSAVFNYGMKHMLKSDKAILFYLHPWELDPSQPRVNQAKWSYQFRHYNNLGRTENKLKSIIRKFGLCNFVSCREYIKI